MPDRCNQHGVYEADETLTLPSDRKGWRGLPTAEIKLRDLGTHWIWATGFQLMQGDCLGNATPLSDDSGRGPNTRRATDREAALYCAKAHLIARLSDRAKEPGDARRIMIWLDTLNPAQLDLFGAAA